MVTVAPADPAVFTINGSGKGSGIIVVVKPDGTQFVADATHPASAGDALVIYCTGLGVVKPPVTAGSPAPVKPPSNTAKMVTVTIGGKPAKSLFAGLTPNFAGLYQVNVVVPSGITAGPNVSVELTVAGSSSPLVTIPIK